jgi:hypothetical protein
MKMRLRVTVPSSDSLLVMSAPGIDHSTCTCQWLAQQACAAAAAALLRAGWGPPLRPAHAQQACPERGECAPGQGAVHSSTPDQRRAHTQKDTPALTA